MFWGVWLHTCICLVTGLLASVEVQVFTGFSSAPHGVFIVVDVFKKNEPENGTTSLITLKIRVFCLSQLFKGLIHETAITQMLH